MQDGFGGGVTEGDDGSLWSSPGTGDQFLGYTWQSLLLTGSIETSSMASGFVSTQQNQPSIQSRMHQAAQAMCGASPAARVTKSVIGGFAIGFGMGAFKGFVSGELFGGELSLGATGLVGAVAGGFIQGAVGAMNGLGTGTALAAECQAGFMYDNN